MSISTMLKKLLYRHSHTSFFQNELKLTRANQFSNKNIKINYLPKVSNELEYDLIQFGEHGMRFWIDYTGSKTKSKGFVQFLRGIIIKTSVARISSIIKPIVREMLGPFRQKELDKCRGSSYQIHDYYSQNSIGMSRNKE